MTNRLLLILIFLFNGIFAQTEKIFTIDGVKRKALFFEPFIKSNNSPVLFFFHGHGGNAKHASRNVNFQEHFPEALVIYPEGIPGVTNSIVDKEGKYNGWQTQPGELQDRDLKFFDEMLSLVEKEYKINAKAVYAAGHSNGSRFVNVLWKMRSDTFAALIMVAGPGGWWMKTAPSKSVWISYGKEDRIVPYGMQKMAAQQYLKWLNADRSAVKTNGDLSIYRNEKNHEIIIEDRNAGHEFPKSSIPAMIDFLMRNTQK